ncbi:hypothetical protein Syun_010126 [Stephania yunnanensis]|uniref:TOG domain-containing protein n=1 Tax=Stephania yunnanensis TaxID=152371 RepID=A0AAP0KIA3_9MAGN
MAELRHRVLTSISNLSDCNTHRTAVENLETTLRNPAHTAETLLMLINCLYESSQDPKPAIKRESLRLLTVLCAAHSGFAAAHLKRVIAHVVKRLKDSDSAVREACREAVGALAGGKVVQVGAANCLAKMVEGAAGEGTFAALQKLCPRICKYLNSHGFQAKAALLCVVSNLAQVRAIAQHSVPTLLQSIYDCLHNTDWATRKAAADALIALASHSSHFTIEGTTMTVAALEACRFDKVKPVRDSMTEALQLWKNIAIDGQNAILRDEKILQMVESTEKSEPLSRDLGNISSDSTKEQSAKGNGKLNKAVGTLKKKAPGLIDKELNSEFFKKHETKSSGDLPVEIVVPRKLRNSSNAQRDEESKLNETSSGSRSSDGINELDDGHEMLNKQDSNGASQEPYRGKHSNSRLLNVDDGAQVGFSRINGHVEGSILNPKGNYLAIQRKLSQLERQQAHLMNMLQDFMSWSRDSMLSLESRVRGLERVVEDMSRDLSATSGIRGSNFMAGFELSGVGPLGKYNRLPEYSTSMLRRDEDAQSSFSERFLSSNGVFSGTRARDLARRSNMSVPLESYSNGALRNGHTIARRTLGDVRPPRTENGGAQTGGRKAWDKGGGLIRLGEGPSARSVWQASKDEATLEAIRVAGEDNGIYQSAVQSAIPESNAEALENNSDGRDPEPIWISWNNALDALHTGDADSAYAEVLSTGDDLLLAKLMYKSGPVIDHLSNEIANELVLALGQFLQELNLFQICLSWIQQLVEIVMENGPDVFGIPLESKRELLLNFHEASSVTDLPEDWEGSAPAQLMSQLASSWSIDLQKLEK